MLWQYGDFLFVRLCAGTLRRRADCVAREQRRINMNGIIYLVGLVVVVLFILSFLGLR